MRRRPPDLTEYRHNPIDSSVAVLDSESVGSSGFIHNLLEDMQIKDLDYLSKHYPEFHFALIKSRLTPKPAPDYKVDRGSCKGHRTWVIANWRGACIP